MDEETNRELRPLVKKFLLTMLNADSELGAIRAINKFYVGGMRKAWRRREPVQQPPFRITIENMRPIIDQLCRQHEPIAHYFFKGCGNMLMYEDSQMAEEVMLHFAGKGVACLPVHDSFVVDIRYANECWEVMREAYAMRYGKEIAVDVIDGLERAKKILNCPRVLLPDKQWQWLADDLIYEIKTSDPSDE
jgi:hypothetical protein